MNDIKPVLMIHEVYDWMLELDLEKYILSFDDGLYSQYKNLEFFKSLNTPKIFFISTGIICPENTAQNPDTVRCADAHKDLFSTGNLENYMRWSQIKEINETHNCFIAGHSHAHLDTRKGFHIKELHKHLVADTKEMMEQFDKEGISIDSFCFPYNYEAPLYKEILKKEGIHTFFGNERISIEELK